MADLSVENRTPLSLVVTADDFGIGRKTSEGICRAHTHGPVTATSFMSITGDHARASAPLLDDVPTLDVGLHVVLTRCGERPLVARASSGLVDRQRDFFSNGQLWVRAFTGKLNRAAVAEEIAAQAEAFTTLLHRQPAYVDGHHHAHQLPVVRDALLDVIAAGVLPAVTRTTVEPAETWRGVGSTRVRRAAARFLGRQAARAFADGQIWTNDAFFGMLAPRDLDQPFPWAAYLDHLPRSGVVEWCVHPGFPDDTLAGRDDYNAARAVELRALTDPAVAHVWERLRGNLSRKSVLSRGAGE